MKQLLITIVAVVLVGCGTTTLSIHKAALDGNVRAVKQHLANGVDVNAKEAIFFEDINFKTSDAKTPLLYAIFRKTSQKERQEAKEIVALLIANGADVNAMGG